MSGANPTAVVHVMGRLDVGGAERMLLQITRRLVSEGHSAHDVVALSGQRGRLSSDFAAAGVRDVPCGIRPVPTFPLRLWRTFRRLRPDIVVSHVSLASGLVLLLAALAGVRERVAVMHSDGDGRSLSTPRRFYRAGSRRLLMFTATTTLGVTSSTLAFAGRSPCADARVVPNAVDLDWFTIRDAESARSGLGIDSQATVLLHIGRAAPEKNRAVLVPCLHALGDDAVLVVSGANAVDDLGDIADVRGRIVNAGLVDDVRPLLAAADVLMLPSIREGLPLVVLEAIASGRPVVATDLPGIRAACGDYPDVSLVPLGTTPEGYAESVRVALRSTRSPGQVRASVERSAHDLNRVLEEWRTVCRPAT